MQCKKESIYDFQRAGQTEKMHAQLHAFKSANLLNSVKSKVCIQVASLNSPIAYKGRQVEVTDC